MKLFIPTAKKKILITFIIVLQITFWSSFKTIYAKVPQVLQLVAKCELPPFKWFENGTLVGIDIEIVVEACKRAGVVANITHRPWNRALMEVKNGKSAGTFSAFKTKEREEYSHFITGAPIHYSTYVLFVKNGKEFKFDTVEDLYGKNIAKNRGFVLSDEFDEAEKKGLINVGEFNNIEKNFELLIHDRVDAIVANLEVSKYTLKEMGLTDQVSILPKPVKKSRGAFLIISKAVQIENKQEIMQKLDAALQEMEKDGTIDKINDKYLK